MSKDALRRNLLNRSLFDLVSANNYLEITSPKLHGWFLYLPAEDRALIQREGGFMPFLKQHPALGVTRQYVYLKYRGSIIPPPTIMSSDKSRYSRFYGAPQCQNCGACGAFGSKKCSHCGVCIEIPQEKICVSENEKQLELLPNSIKEELNVLTTQSDVRMQNIHLGRMQSTLNSTSTQPPSYSRGMCPHAQCLSELWQEVENRNDAQVFQDTSAQASFSLDKELDMQGQVQRNDYTQNIQCHDKLEENSYDVDREMMPEYYSFSSTSLDSTAGSNCSQSAEIGYSDSITATKGRTDLSEELPDAGNASAANSTDCYSCASNSFELAEEAGDSKHSRFEEKIKEIKSKSCSKVYVDQMTDARGDHRPSFTSACATGIDQIFALKNVATDTDLLTVSHDKDSQTLQKATCDMNTITEVHMSDLDVLTEEFIKLKETEKELKQMKSRKASPGEDQFNTVCGCDCAQQVRKAELRLLALQFVMCQQHCWRRYFTSPLCESANNGTEALPDIISETLKTLQKDYQEMRRQIQTGTPLDDLKPLSVNSEKIITGTNYSPALILEAHLDSFECPGSEHGGDEDHAEMRALHAEVLNEADDRSNRDKPLVVLPTQPGTSTETNTGANEDLNDSEAWFDAEEEIGFPNQDGNMKKQSEMRETVNCKMMRKGTEEDESKQSALLCITHLPGSFTEHEVMLWFEKYNATNVYISTFNNNARAAIIYLKSSVDAKTAVKDLNGRSFQGHTIQVMHLCGPVSADTKPGPDQSHSASETLKAETAGDELGTKKLTYSSSHRGPRCSVERLTNVCSSPTASGTCVPQHYATTGSFDTIMARLTERHPDISRQRIVDALLELRAKHQGLLSGLPLRSIVDMTSELLTQASTPS